MSQYFSLKYVDKDFCLNKFEAGRKKSPTGLFRPGCPVDEFPSVNDFFKS